MKRRQFFQTLSAAAAFQRPRRYDVLIRNGEVIDPSRGFRKRADLGVDRKSVV